MSSYNEVSQTSTAASGEISSVLDDSDEDRGETRETRVRESNKMVPHRGSFQGQVLPVQNGRQPQNTAFFNLHEKLNIRIFFAELLGTAIFVTVGRCGKAQVLFGRSLSPKGANVTALEPEEYRYLMYGDATTIAVATGLAYTLGVAISHRVSGGQLNPALTVAYGAACLLPPWSTFFYFLGQFFGVFVGMLVVYTVYVKLLEVSNLQEVIFSSVPPFRFVGNTILLWKEFVGAACLMIGHMAASDQFNSTAVRTSAFIPLLCGVVLTGLQLATCMVSCTEFNPAIALLGRLAYTVSGNGVNVWEEDRVYVAITLLAPFCGALMGSLLYRAAVSWYWPALAHPKRLTLPPAVVKEAGLVMRDTMPIGIARGTQVEKQKLAGQDPIIPSRKVAVVEYQKEPDYDEIAKYIFDVLRNTVMTEQYKAQLEVMEQQRLINLHGNAFQRMDIREPRGLAGFPKPRGRGKFAAGERGKGTRGRGGRGGGARGRARARGRGRQSTSDSTTLSSLSS